MLLYISTKEKIKAQKTTWNVNKWDKTKLTRKMEIKYCRKSVSAYYILGV